MRIEMSLIILALLIHRCTNFVINKNFKPTKGVLSEKITFFGKKTTILKAESIMFHDQRPYLNRSISIKDFNEFYWKKNELINFCKQNNLSSCGNKIEVTQRIGAFLATGKEMHFVKGLTRNQRDSHFKLLTPNTVVMNYKSDKVTRDFFIREIGKHFTFKSTVLNWIKEQQQRKITLTYGDIVHKWKEIYNEQTNSLFQTKIPIQFQFNQFMRDWKLAKAGPGAKKAWVFIRSHRGLPTFSHYMQVRNQHIIQNQSNQDENLMKNSTGCKGMRIVTKN